MLLSIVVPIYNKEKYLNACLESIKNQTYTEIEVLLIDDGSTDNSKIICLKYCDIDNRFKYIYKPNGGVSSARNLGIELSRGEWIGFPDPDDTIEPIMYEKLINSIENGVSIVQCGMNAKDEFGKKHNFIFHPCILTKYSEEVLTKGYDIGFINRSIVNRNDIVEKNIKFPLIDIIEDVVFSTAVLQNCGNIKVIADKLYNYVIYEYSLGHKRKNLDRTFWTNFYKVLYAYIFRSNIFADNMLRERIIQHIVNCIKYRHQCIDFVLPYVNTTRQSWIDNYNKYNGNINVSTKDQTARYQYDDTLKYVLRGIDTYMPWISTVHIIVESDQDIPDYVDRNKVNIIYHSDFIPKKHLPTFNSTTIEAYMPKLLISNRFIYGNDDVFIIDHLTPKDFFDGQFNLIPVDCLEITHEGFFKRDVTCMAFYRNLKESTPPGKRLKHLYKCRHTIGPLLMTNIYKLYKKNESILDTRVTRFRSKDNIGQWYYHYFQCLNDKPINKCHDYGWIDDTYTENAVKNELLKPNRKSICINSLNDKIKNIVYQYLDSKFNKKSSFEI